MAGVTGLSLLTPIETFYRGYRGNTGFTRHPRLYPVQNLVFDSNNP